MERLTRRNIIRAAGAFAGGSALANCVLAASTAGVTADPVMALATRRRALYAEAQPIVDAYSKMEPGADDKREAELWAQQEVFWDQVSVIEKEMMALVATSAAGIAEQVDILRDFVSVSEYEPLIDTVIAGLRTLAAGGAA